MRPIPLLLALLAVLSALPPSTPSSADADVDISLTVPSLTANSFDSAVTNGVWFVIFYAPWCGHCKRLKPVFAELADAPELRLGRGLSLGAVDCTQDKALCERHGAVSFPTLLYFVDGVSYDYKGVRELQPFREFARRVLQPETVQLSDARALQKFTDPKSKLVSFVWYAPRSEMDPLEREVVETVQLRAAGYGGLRFGLARGLSIPGVEDAGATGVAYFNDVLHGAYDGPWTAGAIGDWVEANRHLMVEDLDHTTFYAMGHRGKHMVILICGKHDYASYDFGRPALQAVAATPLRDRFVFGRLDGSAWAPWVAMFGVGSSQYPYVLVYDAVIETYFRNDSHAARIKGALTAGDVGQTTALITELLEWIVAGKERETPLGLKGHLNCVTRDYFPFMLGYLTEMQVVLLLSPVLVLTLVGLLAFCYCSGDEPVRKKAV